MIELMGTCKTYWIHHGRAQKLLLDHINLRVDPGEKWGILGRNEAGKHTFIRMISGSHKSNFGKISNCAMISVAHQVSLTQNHGKRVTLLEN